MPTNQEHAQNEQIKPPEKTTLREKLGKLPGVRHLTELASHAKKQKKPREGLEVFAHPEVAATQRLMEGLLSRPDTTKTNRYGEEGVTLNSNTGREITSPT